MTHALPPEPEITQPFGGVVTRGVALAIDGAAALGLFAVGTIVVSFAFAALGVADIGTEESLVGAGTLWLVFVLVYFVGCWATSGQTLGMRMMGLRLVNGRGTPPSICRSLLRYFARVLSVTIFFAGYALMLVHPRRRTLHDVIAGTFVVYADAPPELIVAALPPAVRPATSTPGLSSATDQTAL